MRYTELIKQKGVNYDYILGLIKDGNGVIIHEFPIDRHSYEIEQALNYIQDESKDVEDVYNLLKNYLPYGSYEYCLAHEYTATYINDIKPVYDLYYKYKEELKKRISDEVGYRKRFLSVEERNNWSVISELEEKARKNHSYLIKKQKIDFFEKAIASIYAYDYETTIKENNIKEDCIVFSSERHGDGRQNDKFGYFVEHKINEDLSVKVKTNFCYGNSTYFNFTITYKGLKLVPYSVWVSYFYAGYATLLRCTKSYNRKRESWHNCINDLAEFINSAIEDPYSFIHDKIIKEVEQFITGLENIFKYGESEIEDLIKIDLGKPGNSDIEIIGVRYANENDYNEYLINPNERSIIYKMEKINGALNFIESLTKISEEYPEITPVIDRIKEMNSLLYPEIKNKIPKVEKEIEELNLQLKPMERELMSIKKSYDKFEQRLLKLQEGLYSKEERDEIANKFRNNHPRFVEVEKTLNKLQPKVRDLENKIEKRDKTIKRLNEFRSLMVKYRINI